MSRILIIDDVQGALNDMAQLLVESGHQAERAMDEGGALLWISDRAVDLVVTNLWCRDIDGMRIIRAIKASDVAIPVVAVSDGRAIPGFDDAGAARLMGADSVVPVPCGKGEAAQLLKCVEYHLARARALMNYA